MVIIRNVFIFSLLILLIVLPFLVSATTLAEIIGSIGGSLFNLLKLLIKPFAFAGPWNIIAVVVLTSSLLLTFVLIDMVISQKLVLKIITPERIVSLVCTGVAFIFICYYIVYNTNSDRFIEASQLKNRQNVILLGTSRTLPSGNANSYYIQRLEAVYELYQLDKIHKIYITGDKTGSYNEPEDMTNDLVRAGIPSTMIQIDTAGYRTLDSILRLKELFNLNSAIVISQDFHLNRALFLCWYYGIDAYGLKARGNMTTFMQLRETLAVPLLILDTMVFNTQPRTGLMNQGAKWRLTFDDVVLVILSLVLLGASVLITYHQYREILKPA